MRVWENGFSIADLCVLLTLQSRQFRNILRVAQIGVGGRLVGNFRYCVLGLSLSRSHNFLRRNLGMGKVEQICW
jgi:hypothetical protein